ncbi:MAG: hypothetical protein NXH91_02970 [Phyllobacteriaceae bacterium]|jgi:hypothetical protein|nr:hypothetical protein [Phyllobacteriaceae bacterium]
MTGLRRIPTPAGMDVLPAAPITAINDNGRVLISTSVVARSVNPVLHKHRWFHR